MYTRRQELTRTNFTENTLILKFYVIIKQRKNYLYALCNRLRSHSDLK